MHTGCGLTDGRGGGEGGLLGGEGSGDGTRIREHLGNDYSDGDLHGDGVFGDGHGDGDPYGDGTGSGTTRVHYNYVTAFLFCFVSYLMVEGERDD